MTKVYGEPECRQTGDVIAPVLLESPRQALLMEQLLHKAMADYAGRPEETLLAKWHNEVVDIRRRARQENWAGWQEALPEGEKAGER
ncbi:MAG: hypothetical protein ABGX47_08210 [Martelella sp.]|uniref:hypothetical protein n=1 Tax=Martelella sp. TaxID=1969699 RepID=UPI0032424472